MKVYPSFRYHKNLEPKVVCSQAEDQALGNDWADSPAVFLELTEERPEGQGRPADLEVLPKARKRRGSA